MTNSEVVEGDKKIVTMSIKELYDLIIQCIRDCKKQDAEEAQKKYNIFLSDIKRHNVK